MKILVLNCGSSSIKYKLFEMESRQVLAQGGLEKINLPGSFLKITLPNGEKKILEREIKEHTCRRTVHFRNPYSSGIRSSKITR